MIIANTGYGNEIISRLPGTLQMHSRDEYWSIQYPVNVPKPLFYDDLLVKLKDKDVDIRSIYKEYAIGYEKKEKIDILINKIRSLLKGICK